MMKASKLLLGLIALAVGTGLLFSSGAALADSLLVTRSGIPLGNLFFFALGLIGIGGAADLLGPKRKPAKDNKDNVAKSQWATRADAAPMLGDTGKDEIYLGAFEGQSLRQRNALHTLVIGPPGSNKSVGVAIPNIQSLRRSMAVMDVKGELAAVTYKARAKLGKVIVLNPFGEMLEARPWLESHRWNPLLYLNARSPDFAATARTIADSIVTKSTGGNGEFFSTSAVNLLTVFLMWEVYSNKDGKPDMANVRDELTRPTVRNKKKQPVGGLLHTLTLMSQCPLDPIRTGGARLLSRLSDANSQSTSINDIIETLLKDLAALLDDPRMCLDMSEGYIPFERMHQEIITIWLVLPLRELENQAKWLRMFFSLALRGLYHAPAPSEAGAKLPPVLLLLDEFANLGRLNEISKALTAARGYAVQMMMIVQSVNQLELHYEKEWPQFFCGSGAVVLFRPKDLKTAEHLSKIYGNRQEMVQTETNNGGSITPTATPLIRAEDLMRLERGQTVTIIENCKWPILAAAPVYSETPFGAGLDPNPYYRR